GDARGAAIRPVAVEWSRGRGFTPSAPDADHSLLESAARSSARQTGATDAHRITRAFLWWPRRPLATLDRKLRQGRKAATVSIDAGAEASWRGHRHLGGGRNDGDATVSVCASGMRRYAKQLSGFWQ